VACICQKGIRNGRVVAVFEFVYLCGFKVYEVGLLIKPNGKTKDQTLNGGLTP